MKLELHVFHHFPGAPCEASKIDEILTRLRDLGSQGKLVMGKIDDLIASVEAETTVVQSAVTLLTQLHDLLVAAGTDPVKLQEVIDKVAANKDALAAAVAANTPSA